MFWDASSKLVYWKVQSNPAAVLNVLPCLQGRLAFNFQKLKLAMS